MTAPQYVDISSWQSIDIDWHAYKAWASQWDGISRVAIRSSEGVGYKDQHYVAYRKGAEESGINVIIHYHYARPDLNGDAYKEADWQRSVVGAIRPGDFLMLDIEQDAPQADVASWSLSWLNHQEMNYHELIRPILYSYDGYIRSHLQLPALAEFPLVLARWTFDPNSRPQCPPPWRFYEFLQYTDKATNIPGIPGTVDADIFLGHEVATSVNYRQVAALDVWASSATDDPSASGIGRDWLDRYVRQGILMPPPSSHEFHSVDWSGKLIVVRQFGPMRCEWWNGVGHWYKY